MDIVRSRSLAKYLVVAGLAGSMLGVSSCDPNLPVPPGTTTVTTTVTTPTPTDQANDAEAKSAVRNAITAVEACYADTQTYISCVGTAEVLALGVTGTAATANGYTLSGRSKSGTVFTATRSGGALVRTCAGASVGCTNGVW